ncbi:MAG: hypothetical protein K6C34_00055 [Alphaproteobacteria bacterium]|nr:hypothetical protein [Alphaproteobacteria bacterium]
MLPWDFGIINAIKKEIEYAIFPSTPPEEQRKTPYLIFELKNIVMGKNLTSRAEFSITIVDDKEVTGICFEILRTLTKLISKELTLAQDDFVLGSARIKLNSVESRKNNLILNFVGILKMVGIYEDDDTIGGR